MNDIQKIKNEIRKINGWKSYAEDEYTKPNQRYTYAKVWKTGLSSYEVKRRGIKKFIFSGRINLGQEDKKYFNKKSEAVNYLKQYMRNN